MAKNETKIETMPTENEREEILKALKKSALGYDASTTTVSKTKSGQPVAKKTTKTMRPDPKAAKAFIELTNSPKEEPKKNKWMQVTDDERILVSTNKLGFFMGVSTVTVNTWERQGCPKEKRGWWDLQAVIAWRGRASGIQGGADTLADKLEADTRLKRARAALAEQEVKLKSGELIPMILVEERLKEVCEDLKNSMLAISDHIMTEIYSQYPELAPQVRRLVDGYVREALKKVAENCGKFEPGQTGKKAVGRPRKRN